MEQPNKGNTAPSHYRFGCQQPVQFLDLPLPVLSPPQNQLLVALIQQRFLTQPWRGPLCTLVPLSDEKTPLAELAWSLAQLAEELLHGAYLPIIERGVVVAVDTKARRCQLALADIGQGSESLRQALRAAIAALEPFIAQPLPSLQTAAANHWQPLEPLIQQQYRWLMGKFVEPCRAAHQHALSERTIIASYLAANIPVRQVSAGVWRAGWGARSQLISGSAVVADSFVGGRLAQDKIACATRLRGAGLPAPDHWLATDLLAAEEAVQRLGWPVVVKPRARDRREGVTVGIANREQLEQALQRVFALGDSVALVEQQIAGTCHRLYVRDGELMYAAKRLPRTVSGDGVRTVAELVAQASRENSRLPPWRARKPLPQGDDCCAAGDAVPSLGERVLLRPESDPREEQYGAEIDNLTAVIHPDNVRLACAAAALFGLSSAGIDLMSEDISVPWHRNGAAINEVNYSPNMAAPGGAAASYLIAPLKAGSIGRIAIYGFAGAVLAAAAKRRWQQLCQRGLRAYLVSGEQTLAPSGEPLAATAQGLAARCEALLNDCEVEALVFVDTGSALLASGAPFDAVDELHLAVPDGTTRQRWQRLLICKRLYQHLPTPGELD